MGALRSDAGEEPVEVGTRVEAAPQAAADKAVEDGRAGTSFDIADEQPVFLAKGARPDGIFHAVIVDLDDSMIEVEKQAVPLPQSVGTGFADRAFRVSL
jgi:hypothetical protein